MAEPLVADPGPACNRSGDGQAGGLVTSPEMKAKYRRGLERRLVGAGLSRKAVTVHRELVHLANFQRWTPHDQAALDGLRAHPGRVVLVATAYPSQATLAARTGYGERSVRDALRELEAAGWVASRRVRSGMRYVVAVPALEAASGAGEPANDAGEAASGAGEPAKIAGSIRDQSESNQSEMLSEKPAAPAGTADTHAQLSSFTLSEQERRTMASRYGCSRLDFQVTRFRERWRGEPTLAAFATWMNHHDAARCCASRGMNALSSKGRANVEAGDAWLAAHAARDRTEPTRLDGVATFQRATTPPPASAPRPSRPPLPDLATVDTNLLKTMAHGEPDDERRRTLWAEVARRRQAA